MYADKIEKVALRLGEMTAGVVHHADAEALIWAKNELLSVAEGVRGMEATFAPEAGVIPLVPAQGRAGPRSGSEAIAAPIASDSPIPGRTPVAGVIPADADGLRPARTRGGPGGASLPAAKEATA